MSGGLHRWPLSFAAGLRDMESLFGGGGHVCVCVHVRVRVRVCIVGCAQIDEAKDTDTVSLTLDNNAMCALRVDCAVWLCALSHGRFSAAKDRR